MTIKNKAMKLKEFLNLISDEEVRIELEIEEPSMENYIYACFWLSDYRTYDDSTKLWCDYVVDSFSFSTEYTGSDIAIHIKPSA